jgi:alkylhydroperoxidase family enzyme
MTRVKELADGPTDLDRVWGRRPEFYQQFMADHARSIARVDPVIVELARLRMAAMFGSTFAQALRYRPAIAAGLSEDKIAALSQYGDSPMFTAQERACLEFAEHFAIQASSIGDEEVARLQDAMGPEAMIYFVKALSVMDQLLRSTVAFGFEAPTVAPPTMPGFEPLRAAA